MAKGYQSKCFGFVLLLCFFSSTLARRVLKDLTMMVASKLEMNHVVKPGMVSLSLRTRSGKQLFLAQLGGQSVGVENGYDEVNVQISAKRNDRARAEARSLRAIVPLSRYVATEFCDRALRPSVRSARSQRSDRARAEVRSLCSD
ncbi:hypothetical protein F2Q69_00054161 [Brassica cretica]|uniref:Uncharacterized protein n=1 Tax=Brassica cretica TaxID=69181 RepID=A0A8S9N7U8_BRACR|nr:hypothetical protein F2Q69_00054161 [Brassica cretica]